jgi:hypothetical protein
MQLPPAAFPAQVAQVPLAPHAPGAVPATQVVPEQQAPPLQVPSPAAPHAEVQAPAAQVGVPPEQALHVPPLVPQGPLALPGAHCPESASQLHAVLAAPPQAVPQACVVVLQASPAGQSAAVLHPHVCVWATHTDPAAFPVQSRHAPEAPQAVLPVPGRQAPPVPQQPATHGVPGTAQMKVHRPVPTLHPALPPGQSELAAHPHCPPPPIASHARPLVPPAKPPAQPAHRPPFAPHSAASVPT